MVRLKLDSVLKKRRISRRRFAKEMGVREAYVYALLKADANPTLRTLARVAKTLKVKVRDLIEE